MNETFKMSWRAGDLIVFWLCFIAVSEAALLANCNENDSSNCTANIESCIGDSCECSSGHFDVSNVCKSSSITVTLTTQPGSVVYGSTVILTATITSEVPLNPIKWLNGSKEINISSLKYTQNGDGPGTVTLTIHNVDFTDSGNYKVEVSNLAGTTSTSNQVLLTVTGDRPIVTVPGTITETDTTVTIHCTASGSPALTAIHWLLNDINLSSTDKTKYSGGNLIIPSLTINKIASTDIGEYRCVATNLVGSTTSSQSVTLGPPSAITIPQQPASPVNYNSSVTFTGSYTSNPLSVTIKWQKLVGGTYMDINTSTVKYLGSSVTGSSPKLQINLVQLIDETSYRLMVSNGVGSSLSNIIPLNIIEGNLKVTTGASVTGRHGGSITIGCTVTGPEVNKIQWMKYINNAPENIIINDGKYSGGSVSTEALTIHTLNANDAAYQYQCTASNPRGIFSSSNKAAVQLKYGQFYENCTELVPCGVSVNLKCTNNRCLCISTYYHKDRVCYSKTGLAPTVNLLNSNTSAFSVIWNNPTTHYDLVLGYEVNWRVSGFSTSSSGSLGRTENQYTVSKGLMSGQMYIVNVISNVTLTDPTMSIVVASADSTVRLDPLSPGPIVKHESNLSYNNLYIKWTAPNNTVITKYEVTIDGATYSTNSNSIALVQVRGNNFTPGQHYYVSIVTVSGETHVKKSAEHAEWIRIISTKPDPPTDVKCPDNPLDVSLHISWEAPTNANGIIQHYKIFIPSRNPSIILTSSNVTNQNVDGLLQEQTYTFTAYAVNDADEFIRESGPSQPVSCKTRADERPTADVGTISEMGTTVTIHCNASVSQGSPALTNIHWLVNNVNLSLTDNDKYSGGNLNTPSLTINNIASSDIGEYRCVATNLVGSTTSSQSVTLGPPSAVTILQQPASPVNYNSSVTFTGSYTSNPLSVTIKWQKLVGYTYMDINISAEKYLGSSITGSSPKLQMNLVQLIDETSYRLMVSNGVGSSLSNSIRLNIIEGNLTVTMGASVTGRHGGSITIGCTVTGPEVNKIQWMKYINNAPENIIINDGKYSGGSVSTEALTIHTLNANDAAYQYQCTASNARGVFSSSIKAAVQLKYGQFYENCTELVPCDASLYLTCTNNRCLCISAYYHKDKVCYSRTGLAPTVNLLNSTTSAFSVFWNNPSNHYDLVIGYEVNWRVSGFSTSSSGSLDRTENQYTVSKGLMSGQMYIVNVISNVTLTDPTMSIVVASADSTVRLVLVSSAPTNLNMDGIQSRGFRIQFNRPDDVNGIIAAYKIVISEGGNCVQQILVHGICSVCKSTVGCPSPINHTVPDIANNDVSYTVTGLNPYTHYMVKVVAINGEGEGHPVNETVRTDEEVPLQPGQITASNVQSSSLTLAWTLPVPSPGNTTYTIYTYEGTDDNGTRFLMKESTKVYGFETKMLSVAGLEVYWPYRFKVNAATVKGNTTSDFSSIFKTKKTKQAVIKDDEITSTSSIIGSVVAVILVVAVVVIGIFLWKRNQRHKEYKERTNTYADLKLDERTKVDQPYSFLEHGRRTVNSKSVPLNSFYDYVVDLLNNSRQKLTKEYHDLLQDTERSALTVASSKDNVSKNRGNIIPYDFNRVRLCSPGASDYIDASVLLDKCYILTSYPIAKTFGNFWQMVWEQNVSTIVVMTGQSDDRESWYFSDNEGTVRTMERIDVELLAKFKSSESVTMRKIKLSRGKHSKVVNHFLVISLEMTDLPDQILALINTITQNNVKNTGPQVVHGGCTGVDNSGVYIAVDYAVKSVVSGGNEIDVYGTARTVMKERMFSISSLEQYSAIHTCLQKYVQNSPACKNDATGAYEYLP